jgi:hypothetical protein
MIFKKIGNMEDVEVICHYLGFNENDFPKSITRQRELRSFL